MTSAWLPRIVAIAFSLLVAAGNVTELNAQQAAGASAASPGAALAARHPDVFKPGVDPANAIRDELAAIPFEGRNALKYSLLAALFAACVEVPVAAPLHKYVVEATLAEGIEDVAVAVARGLVKSLNLSAADRVRFELQISGFKGATDFASFIKDLSKLTNIDRAEFVVFGAGLPETVLDLIDAAQATPAAAGEFAIPSSSQLRFMVQVADGLASSECEYEAARLMLRQAEQLRRQLADNLWQRLYSRYRLLARKEPLGPDPTTWSLYGSLRAGEQHEWVALRDLAGEIERKLQEIEQVGPRKAKTESDLRAAEAALYACDTDRGRAILDAIRSEYFAPRLLAGLETVPREDAKCWGWVAEAYNRINALYFEWADLYAPGTGTRIVGDAFQRGSSALDQCQLETAAAEIAGIERALARYRDARCLDRNLADTQLAELKKRLAAMGGQRLCHPALVGAAPGPAQDAAAPREPPCQRIDISPQGIEVTAGDAVTFSATAWFADGSRRDVTAEAQWQPGPGGRYTAPADLRFSQRVRISATYGSCVGSIEITALPPSWTPPLSHADQIGARAEPAQPGDYTWFVLCPKEALDGTMVYGQQPSLARYHLVAGPFEGPRTADQWIKTNCPRARCTADGACAQDPAYSPMPAWSVVCDKGDRRLYKTQSVNLARHWVLRERLLGEPDAELWIQRNCPSRLCADGGACAAADQYRTGGKWAVVCDRSHGGVALTEYPNRGTQHVWIENLYAEVDARQWADRRCPSWRCDRDGRCLPGDRPLENTSAGRPVEVPLDTVLGLFGQREASRSSASQSAGSSTGGAALGSTGTTSRYGSGTLDGAMRERAEGSGGHGGSGGGTGPRTGTGTGSGTTTPGRCSGNADCPPGQQCSAAGVCVTVAGSGSTTTPATSTPGASTPAATPAPAPAPSAPAMPQKSWIVFHPCAATGGWWCLLQMADTTEAELRKKNKTLTILGSYPSENVALTTTCARISEVFRGGEFAPGYGSALGMVGGVKLAVGSFVIWNSASSSYRCRDRYYP